MSRWEQTYDILAPNYQILPSDIQIEDLWIPYFWNFFHPILSLWPIHSLLYYILQFLLHYYKCLQTSVKSVFMNLWHESVTRMKAINGPLIYLWSVTWFIDKAPSGRQLERLCRWWSMSMFTLTIVTFTIVVMNHCSECSNTRYLPPMLIDGDLLVDGQTTHT